jgi:hypothetical protein
MNLEVTMGGSGNTEFSFARQEVTGLRSTTGTPRIAAAACRVADALSGRAAGTASVRVAEK